MWDASEAFESYILSFPEETSELDRALDELPAGSRVRRLRRTLSGAVLRLRASQARAFAERHPSARLERDAVVTAQGFRTPARRTDRNRDDDDDDDDPRADDAARVSSFAFASATPSRHDRPLHARASTAWTSVVCRDGRATRVPPRARPGAGAVLYVVAAGRLRRPRRRRSAGARAPRTTHSRETMSRPRSSARLDTHSTHSTTPRTVSATARRSHRSPPALRRRRRRPRPCPSACSTATGTAWCRTWSPASRRWLSTSTRFSRQRNRKSKSEAASKRNDDESLAVLLSETPSSDPSFDIVSAALTRLSAWDRGTRVALAGRGLRALAETRGIDVVAAAGNASRPRRGDDACLFSPGEREARAAAAPFDAADRVCGDGMTASPESTCSRPVSKCWARPTRTRGRRSRSGRRATWRRRAWRARLAAAAAAATDGRGARRRLAPPRGLTRDEWDEVDAFSDDTGEGERNGGVTFPVTWGARFRSLRAPPGRVRGRYRRACCS